MIYLKDSFNLEPASPATRDQFVESVETRLLPALSEQGARLVGGWFAHEEWFTQIVHVTEFDDASGLDRYREASQADSMLAKAQAELASLAPERRAEVLEPLGPVPASTLREAIDASAKEPVGVYTFAILEVNTGSMDRFSALLSAAASALPIVASWRDVAGNPNRVIDLWKGDTGKSGYQPTNDRTDAFFEPLREVAPREKMMRLHSMPYSPLR
ncbi:MAG: NIPSNAP family protein [Myxococcota bacterium]|nr:NIPSNAP family protein [Myxococcota bacterium]